jgi:hypothetical protein
MLVILPPQPLAFALPACLFDILCFDIVLAFCEWLIYTACLLASEKLKWMTGMRSWECQIAAMLFETDRVAYNCSARLSCLLFVCEFLRWNSVYKVARENSGQKKKRKEICNNAMSPASSNLSTQGPRENTYLGRAEERLTSPTNEPAPRLTSSAIHIVYGLVIAQSCDFSVQCCHRRRRRRNV